MNNRSWMLGAILLMLAGCASPKPAGADSSRVIQREPRIDEINLVAMPLAIDVDSAPGVDGFALKVYAVNRARPKALPIESGTLDILMTDGLLREASADSSRYRRVWSYSAEQLKGFAFSSVVGTGYRFALNWGTDQPRADKITVVVRHRPAQGPAILSAPSSITIPGK